MDATFTSALSSWHASLAAPLSPEHLSYTTARSTATCAGGKSCLLPACRGTVVPLGQQADVCLLHLEALQVGWVAQDTADHAG